MGDLSFGCFGFLGMTMTCASGSLRVELSIVGFICPNEWSVDVYGQLCFGGGTWARALPSS